MPHSDQDKLIARIHDAPLRLVLAVTGGGSGAISALLEQPGASRTVLQAGVPYCEQALADFLGARPEKFCSPRTARAMAMAAFQRARVDNPGDRDAAELAGIGCTASLASDRPKRGAHRAHLAVQTAAATWTGSLQLVKDQRTRGEEERVVTRWILNVIAKSAGIEEQLPLDLAPKEEISETRTTAPSAWRALLLGEAAAVHHADGRDEVIARTSAPAVFPGAFNPLHDGHRQMAACAATRLGVQAAFEISIANVDKPPLDYTEMAARASQFDNASLWFTRAATFVEKARIFPGTTFLVGADTISRIAAPRYYGDSRHARDEAIDKIVQQQCRFLVFGRRTGDRFEPLNDLELPKALKAICDEVEETDFRADVSSTELRQNNIP